MHRFWLLISLVSAGLLLAAPGWGTVESGVAWVADGATLTFPQAFHSSPIVICSAQANGKALMAAATGVNLTGFVALLRDTFNRPPAAGAWVQWVAATSEPGVRCGTASVTQGGTITFPSPFNVTPTIVTSGLQGGGPLMVTAINNAPTGFGIWFTTHAGSSAGSAQVNWIATVPRSTWRCGLTRYNDGGHLSFDALPAIPTIVTSGNCVGAVATCAVGNQAAGATLTLRKHDDTSAQSVWVQWWALPGGVASYQPPLVLPH